MIDLKILKDNPELIKEELKARNSNLDFAELQKLDTERRKLSKEADELRAKRPKLEGKPNPEELEALRKQKEELQAKETELATVKKSFNKLYFQLPNLRHKTTPIGKDDKDNVQVKTWGDVPKFSFNIKPHEQILDDLDLADIAQGSKVSGTRFWYLKGQLVQLQFGLMAWLMEKLVKKGFEPVIPPTLVKRPAMFGTGFFPAEENEIYQVINDVDDDKDDLFLVGTAEVPLASLWAGKTIKKTKRYVGYSSCWRKEAGTYGKDMAGIFRGHQFDKMEIFVFANPKESWQIHEEILQINEEILQDLKLPYQVLNMCTGDIGAPNAKKYDLEAWFPGQNKYRELISCSHDTDFQARRLGIKFAGKSGKKEFAHTLNTTSLAFGRAMACILENYQQADGTVSVPKVVQKYCGLKKIG